MRNMQYPQTERGKACGHEYFWDFKKDKNLSDLAFLPFVSPLHYFFKKLSHRTSFLWPASCLLMQLERFTSMRMKKDKEKPGHMQGQRHSSAASYEISAQSAMLHDHTDEYVLDLFEQMLVRKSKKPRVKFCGESHFIKSLKNCA